MVKRWIEDSAAGFRQLELLAKQTQRSEAPIPIVMQNGKGTAPGDVARQRAINCSRSTRWPCRGIAIATWSAEPTAIQAMCWC